MQNQAAVKFLDVRSPFPMKVTTETRYGESLRTALETRVQA